MLRRLYVNHFRCLVNFEVKFGSLHLIMGANGCGKSTVFDIVDRIRRFVTNGAKVTEVFPPEDLTSWVARDEQRFEVDVEGNGGLYAYRLAIGHTKDRKKERVDLEELLFNGNPLFRYEQGSVHLFHDDHEPGPIYPFDWSYSSLSTIISRSDNTKLTWFKNWLEQMIILKPLPQDMTALASEESSRLEYSGANFASWYRYLSQEHQDRIFSLINRLKEIVPGFYSFKLEQEGNTRVLRVGFADEEIHGSSPFYFDFDRLSDGQRILLVLYSLLCDVEGQHRTLFLDEPGNYLSIDEIQPWLVELSDLCAEEEVQAVLISHNPELIDYLGGAYGLWMDREPLGPARIRAIALNEEEGKGEAGAWGQPLKLSERIARGWQE